MNFVHNFEPTSTLKANKGCANICLRFSVHKNDLKKENHSHYFEKSGLTNFNKMV